MSEWESHGETGNKRGGLMSGEPGALHVSDETCCPSWTQQPRPSIAAICGHGSLGGRIAKVPSKYRTLYLRAVEGKVSPRQAIKAKCQECCGWEDVTVRVGSCAARTCPLWPLRPYQDPQEAGQPVEPGVLGADGTVDGVEAADEV